MKIFFTKTKFVEAAPEISEVAANQKSTFLQPTQALCYKFLMAVGHVLTLQIVEDEIKATFFEIASYPEGIAFDQRYPTGKTPQSMSAFLLIGVVMFVGTPIDHFPEINASELEVVVYPKDMIHTPSGFGAQLKAIFEFVFPDKIGQIENKPAFEF